MERTLSKLNAAGTVPSSSEKYGTLLESRLRRPPTPHSNEVFDDVLNALKHYHVVFVVSI